MTAQSKHKPKVREVESVLLSDPEHFKRLLKESLEELLEAQMSELLRAAPGERTDSRQGYRAGYYTRGLVTRIGKLELRVPQNRESRFSTDLSAISAARRP